MQCIKLCLVTHRRDQPLSLYKHFLQQAIEGGVTSIQLREKEKDIAHIQQIAIELLEILHPYRIPLIINDHVHLAKAVGAQGVHLGQSDISPIHARQLLGRDKIIGLSIESPTQLHQANQLDCIDYVAASAIFSSQSKTDCKTIWGLEGLQQLVNASKHPVVAIGGINQSNAAKVMKSGASGIAVIGALHHATCPRQAASALIHTIESKH